MKRYIHKFLGLFLLFGICGRGFSFAQDPIPFVIVCGDNNILGNIAGDDTTDIEVSVEVIDKESNEVIDIFENISLYDSGYYLQIYPKEYDYKEHIINIIARKGDETVQQTKNVVLGANSCSNIQDLMMRIQQYADEVKEYLEHAKDEQQFPDSFLKTGLGDLLEKTIAKTEQRFALGSSNIYHDLPIRSYNPNNDKRTSFAGQYSILPGEYRNADAYFRFKGLLIPIQSSSPGSNEKELLRMLNKGAILAPGIDSLDDTGIVKMVYNHAVSTTKSPFAGVGSHLSVFSELGDELRIYVKVAGYENSYEEKIYFLQHKLELLPKETENLNVFKKEGVDILAFITCKYGNVLGSLEGREILLFNRKTEELGIFQKAIIHMNTPGLQDTKDAMDNYFTDKNLSDQDVVRLVTKLEELEKSNTNQLKIIATYGKYMASYDALYN